MVFALKSDKLILTTVTIERIVSGAQTGADRAALDVGIAFGIDVGGWIPKGRLDENGKIPETYPNLMEAENSEPGLRTELNVRDSDATLLLSHGALVGGSELTKKLAIQLGKPWKHVDLAQKTTSFAIAEIKVWLEGAQPRVLNIAGARASEDPLIYAETRLVLEGVLMNESLSILMPLRESVMAQCGRWDQIRWQVPSWFCTLGTLSVGFAQLIVSSLHNPFLARLFFFALSVFGTLCALLLINLIRYESATVAQFNADLDKFHLRNDVRAVLKIVRPFSFSSRTILLTATFWFLLYIIALTTLFLDFAILVPAWVR
jgi:putative molybdenum carrier protein